MTLPTLKKLVKGILEMGAEEEMPSPKLTQAPDSAFGPFGKRSTPPTPPAGEPDATPSMPTPSFGQATVEGIVSFLNVPENLRNPGVEIIISGLLDATGPGQLINGADRIARTLRRLKKK